MTLVIAEKKSAGEAIANVIGAKQKKDGYYEGNSHIVTWCVGHLIGLADPSVYDEKYVKWSIADLPIIPDKWLYRPNSRTKAQLKTVKDLLKRSDIKTVVNACDSGREGELIFREIYEQCNCKIPFKRLWISSMEESAISEGFKTLRAGRDYENLYQSALCRSKADWLVGMNYSRLFGCVYKINGCSIGRVQTPTLAMIVNREEKIANFVKEPFYIVEISNGEFTTSREKISDKSVAETILKKCNDKTATVASVVKQEKTEAPPKLFDLTTLQKEANRMFGFSASQTLKCVQSLYEAKLLTYPRTDSRYITEDMAGRIPSLVDDVAGILPFDVKVESCNVGCIVNNAKVSDHHAIIPTPTTAGVSLSSLDSDSAAKRILLMVCTRLVSAVGEKHVFAETVVSLDCEGEALTAKEKTVVKPGWKAIEQAFSLYCGKDRKTEEKPLPPISEGQQFSAEATMREGFTSPPKHYNEDLLLSAMETAGREDMPEDAERMGIGTPATRADIIEKLIKQEYIVRDGKLLLPTEKGVNLIKVLPESVKSPLLTADWEDDLKRMERGEITAARFMNSQSEYIAAIIKHNNTAKEEFRTLFSSDNSQFAKEALGKCPWCGESVYENKAGFSCSETDCKFVIWKENKYYSPLKGKTLTAANAKALLTDGKVFLKGLLSKDGKKKYDATLILDDGIDERNGNRVINFKMEFPKK
ncbi:MAG: DNA topoisomerase 3 [Clostridiales bacterium]|nr:DNA topoisomerase 3 [Clostridiales bacterium]